MSQIPLFKSYFKLALRHSWKNKWSVLINVLGLGAALSMCIFVYSIYAYNLEFDTFYKDVDNVYRVHSMTQTNGFQKRNELSPGPFDYVLRNEISGISGVASVRNVGGTVKVKNDYFEEAIGVVSSDFFTMFETPLWYGSYVDFENQPAVYLSKKAAKRFFGDEVALGEKLDIYFGTNKVELLVAGVIENVPTNVSFDFPLFINEKTLLQATARDKNDWNSHYYMAHYIKADPTSISGIVDRLETYLPQQNEAHKEMKITSLELTPFLSSIHSQSAGYRSSLNQRIGPEPLIIFTVLAAMIFLVACFNLANSSMAMISNRLKEIGIRKTLGSENHKILIQFLMEMGVVCTLALIIGLAMVNSVSSAVLGLFGASFPIQNVHLDGIVAFLLLFLAVTTLIAGLMPALYAWKFQPIAIMRKSVKLRGVNWINKILTVAQYAFSISVLTAAISFSNNVDFLKDLDPGYADELVYVLKFSDQSNYEPIKEQVDQIAGVTTSGADNHIQLVWMSGQNKLLEIDTSAFQLRIFAVDDSYLDFMEIPITLGRSFLQNSEAEEGKSMIVSQQFVDDYFAGLDPIGKIVKVDGKDRTIVGVTPNFIQDVYQDAEDQPLAFLPNDKNSYRYLVAKFENGDKSEIERQIKEIWSDQVDMPFNGNWQKDLALGTAAKDSENLKLIFFWMAVLGCLLSIAGIFSLSKLNIAKRIKEISIRKVLGSTIRQLLLTINRSFIITLSISVATGSVFGFLISHQTLAMVYRYYESASPVISAMTGLFIGAMALLIIILSILAPARANPAIGLRQE